MIYIIGTVHVIDIKEKVKSQIQSIKPDAVAIELDGERYNRLVSPSPPSLRNPQELIARLYGARAGDDMRGGIEGAEEVNAELYLIDEDIREVYRKLEGEKEDSRITIRRFLEDFPQVFKLSSSYIKALLQSFKVLLSKGKKEALEGLMDFFIADVERNPKLYRELPQLLSPSYKQILLDEREEHMVKEIRTIASKHEKVVVVTGLAHLYGLKNLLKDLEVRCIPTSEIV
jgi:pheromone shutdown protein TraB